jgi:hypothetical protein
MIASSKTSFKPCCVSAEHSTYFTALIFLAHLTPSSYVTGRSFFFASFSTSLASFRKSVLVPTLNRDHYIYYSCVETIYTSYTNRIGLFGQFFFISCIQSFWTFRNELGMATEKHMRNTSVCG